MRIAISILVAFLGLTAAAAADDLPAKLELDVLFGDMKRAPIRVDGEPIWVIFDTGSGITGIGPKTAEAIGCESFGRMVGFRMSGEALSVPWCGRPDVDVAGVKSDEMVMFFDVGSVLPDDWPEVDGILSLAAYQDQVVTLDWSENLVIFESPDSLQERTKGLTPGRIHQQREVSGYGLSLFLEVEAEPQPLRVLLDSGNVAGTILAPHAFEILGVEPPAPPTDNSTSETVTMDFVVSGTMINPQEVFVEEIIYDGNFGTAFLNGHVITFDIASSQVWIVPK